MGLIGISELEERSYWIPPFLAGVEEFFFDVRCSSSVALRSVDWIFLEILFTCVLCMEEESFSM